MTSVTDSLSLFCLSYPFFSPLSLLLFLLSLALYFSVSLSVYLSAVDHSGTLGTGEPIVNAIKSDSALIGGNRNIFLMS